ncbi:hypothetical protein SM139_1306, partial [Stenotrophomonas maltophilia]
MFSKEFDHGPASLPLPTVTAGGRSAGSAGSHRCRRAGTAAGHPG